MYLTKIIERYGLMDMAIKDIDKEAEKMYSEGYELVTYQFINNNEAIIMTFKKKEN